jgi:hypothetical protein
MPFLPATDFGRQRVVDVRIIKHDGKNVHLQALRKLIWQGWREEAVL